MTAFEVAGVPPVRGSRVRGLPKIGSRGGAGRPRSRVLLPEACVVIFFALIACLAYWKLVFQGLILVDYDAFVYFYANREYTASRLLQGQLPLWNPYIFAGIPHLANPQSAVFYPGTWIFLLLPTPYAYTVNLVVHTALAGWAMSLLTRAVFNVGRVGGIVAGVCYMLSGAITAQGGHLNQLSAAALLPLILLAGHRSISRISVRWSLIAAMLLGLQLMAGHPQVTYMTLILLAFMLVWTIASSEPRLWVAQSTVVILAGVLAVGLAAVQLLPTLEATRLGIRSGGLSIGEAAASSLPPGVLPLALLPGFTENPPSTEFLGFIGASGLTLAILGVTTAMAGRQSWVAVAAMVSLLLALGSNFPLFESLFGVVPGLDAFRVPSRWLLPWTVCVSMLAGAGLGTVASVTWMRRGATLVIASIPVALAVWASQSTEVTANYAVPALAINAWLALLAVTLLLWLLRLTRVRPLVMSMGILLVACELLAARVDLPFSHAVPEIAWKAQSETARALQAVHPSFRSLSIAGDGYQPERTAELREHAPNLSDYAFDLLLTAIKWADVQAPNLPAVYGAPSVDGYDGGVFPLKNFVLAASLFHPLGDIRPDGVLISSLDAIPRKSAMDAFAVNAVVVSSEKDVEVNGVGFDRAVETRIRPSQSASPTDLPDWPASRLALLIGFEDVSPRVGDSLLEIRASDISGRQTVIPLTAGISVPLAADVVSGKAAGTLVPPWRASSGLPSTTLVDVILDLQSLEHLEIENVSSDANVIVAGASLLGNQNGQQQALILDPTLTAHTAGDERVYIRSDALPRAFLTHRAVALTDEDANVAMFEPDWSPRTPTLLEPNVSVLLDAQRAEERADLVRSLPEEVLIDVDASSAGLLVLSDAYYPGWVAEIDGSPTPTYRANVHFRAIEVPSGRHAVRFVYDPATLRIGAIVSAVTLGLVLVLAIIGRRMIRVLQ